MARLDMGQRMKVADKIRENSRYNKATVSDRTIARQVADKLGLTVTWQTIGNMRRSMEIGNYFNQPQKSPKSAVEGLTIQSAIVTELKAIHKLLEAISEKISTCTKA